jgi:hypothetical protein
VQPSADLLTARALGEITMRRVNELIARILNWSR